MTAVVVAEDPKSSFYLPGPSHVEADGDGDTADPSTLR
jgi:hypothetical protein